MATPQNFRSAFNGFNRQDVVHYLEYINTKHQDQINSLTVIFDRKAYQISGKLFADIASYIDDRYVDEHTDSRSERLRRMSAFRMEDPMPCESSVCQSLTKS